MVAVSLKKKKQKKIFFFFFFFFSFFFFFFFFQAEDGIRDRSPSRGLGDVYKRQVMKVNEIIRELIMNQANADEIRDRAFDKSGRTLLSLSLIHI